MRVLLMALGAWAGGFTASHLLKSRLTIIKECPKCIKCWIASLACVLFWAGEYFFCIPVLKTVFSGPEYFFSVLFASLFGAAIYLVLCPIRSLESK
jgi:hypothetical protein